MSVPRNILGFPNRAKLPQWCRENSGNKWCRQFGGGVGETVWNTVNPLNAITQALQSSGLALVNDLYETATRRAQPAHGDALLTPAERKKRAEARDLLRS